jgi:hypothetical protein
VLIEIHTDDRNVLAFLKWVEGLVEVPSYEVEQFLYAVNDSVVR